MNEFRRFIALLSLIFLATMGAGLYIGSMLDREEVSFTENPDDPANAGYLFLTILISTAVFMFVLFIYKGKFLFRVLEVLAVFSSAVVFFDSFSPDESISLLAALMLLCARLLWRNIITLNIVTAIAVSAVGAVFGVSLGVVPSAILLVLVSIYDYIAVFKTKHMIVIAKAAEDMQLPFMFALPAGDRLFRLGTGDVVLPLMFAVSLMRGGSMFHALAVVAGAWAALVGIIIFMKSRKGMYLPAMPFMSAGCFAGLFAAALLGALA